MGWGHGILADGREAGYNVEAVCDNPDCDEQIYRHVEACCSGEEIHNAGEHGCGLYFCDAHVGIHFGEPDDDGEEPETPHLCDSCGEKYLAAIPAGDKA